MKKRDGFCYDLELLTDAAEWGTGPSAKIVGELSVHIAHRREDDAFRVILFDRESNRYVAIELPPEAWHLAEPGLNALELNYRVVP